MEASENSTGDPQMDTHEVHQSHVSIVSLIRAVKRRGPIWDRQHPQYKDREYSMMLWEEVSKETSVDGKFVKMQATRTFTSRVAFNIR